MVITLKTNSVYYLRKAIIKFGQKGHDSICNANILKVYAKEANYFSEEKKTAL